MTSRDLIYLGCSLTVIHDIIYCYFLYHIYFFMIYFRVEQFSNPAQFLTGSYKSIDVFCILYNR